jgi:hypothetical protein
MESIEVLNDRLLNLYGKFENVPAWRIVYSEDQFEKRLTWFTDEGFALLTPVMKLLPKYKQWLHNCYVLERAMPVPITNQKELTELISYEPVWSFVDKNNNSLPPKWEVIEIVIRSIYQASAMAVGAKYKDPENDEPIAAKAERIAKIEEELFGNESYVGDALAHKQAVVVPNKPFVN